MTTSPQQHPDVEDHADHADHDDHDRGLQFDVRTLLDRRRALTLLGGIGVSGVLAACSADAPAARHATSGAIPSSTSTLAASRSASATSATAPVTSSAPSSVTSPAAEPVVEAPDETAGPYPGDGSNGPNVLDDAGIVRADIRSSFGTSTTTAEGVPLTLRLTVKDSTTSQALVGAAVYVWQCDRAGEYSMYSRGAAGENYLRGVQATDETGTVTFTSIFPGCYSGRWPHVHFEVYASLADATTSGPIVKTSQLALPEATCHTVYATAGYERSVANLSRLSLESDNVFGDDGGIHQVATMSGDLTKGYAAALTVGV